MARSNIPLDFPTPDFARIREESGLVTERAVRSATDTNYTGPLTIRGSVETEGYVTTGGSTILYCYKTDHSAWPSSITNNVDVRGMITLQVAQ
jgi:hypothetical protein